MNGSNTKPSFSVEVLNISKKGPFFFRECNNKTNEVQCTSLEFLWNMGNSNKLWPTEFQLSIRIKSAAQLFCIASLRFIFVVYVLLLWILLLNCHAIYNHQPLFVAQWDRSSLCSRKVQTSSNPLFAGQPIEHMDIHTWLSRCYYAYIYLRLLKQILTQTHTVRNKQWFELGKHFIYIYIFHFI